MNYSFIKTPPVNIVQLQDEITTAGLPAVLSISIDDVNLTLEFSGELDSGQQVTLTNTVAIHTPTPGYVSLATQAQIATLTGYLNNPNPTIANTARAIVVSVLAPNLPPNILTTINARIVVALGG